MNSRDLDQEILEFIRRGAHTPRNETFNPLALRVFVHQAENIPVYRAFLETERISPSDIRRYEDIPLFPTSGFKHHRIASFPKNRTVATFHTTGTTTQERGTHELDTVELYDEASAASFRDFVSLEPDHHALLSLIPTRFDSPRSSLAHMVDTLGRSFFRKEIYYAFYDGKVDCEAATEFCTRMAQRGIPLFVAATAIALADWLEHLARQKKRNRLPAGSALFETGGRKGRRRVPEVYRLAEMADDLLGIPIQRYFGEYGMTELCSPSWGSFDGETLVYRSPAWAPVRILDPQDGQEVVPGKEGVVSVFDLANRGSISALLTGDWGRRHTGGFEILGRIVDSELRGCSLAVFKTEEPSQKSNVPVETIRNTKEKIFASKGVPLSRTIESLGRLAALWRNSESAERKKFEASLKATHTYSSGSVCEGLNRTFEALSEERLADVARRTWPNGRRETTPHQAVSISAGNLPVTGVFGLFTGLLSGVPTLHRPSSRSGGLLQELLVSLSKIDADLAALTAVLETSSENDDETRELFRDATDLFAQGDDETLEHLLTLAPVDCRFYPYRSRMSFAVATATDEGELRSLLEDVYIWEQQGCLSPQVLFVSGLKEREIPVFADRLHKAAVSLAEPWNRNPTARNVGERLWHRLGGEAQENGVFFSESPQLTLAFMPRIHAEWFSTPGFLQVLRVDTPRDLSRLLDPFREHVSSAALSSHAFALVDLPIERTVRFGELQSPSLDWPADGHDRLRYVLTRRR